jgi:acyl carrier protein
MDALTLLFAEVLKVDPATLSEDTSPKDIPTWDSLGALNLVVAIEAKFGKKLSARDIMSMRTIGLSRGVLLKKNVVI